MIWSDIDWSILDRLRDGFLRGTAAAGPYWQSAADLAHYDFTFAERIGWKWDHLLAELAARGWSPPAGSILDWGCGSGVAGRRVLAQWPAVAAVSPLRLADHSRAAVDFATTRAQQQFPAVDVAPWRDTGETIGTLIVSHVLNELSAEAEAGLLGLIARSRAVLWVEPGTSKVAGRLVRLRESLRLAHRVLLPCPHQDTCGLLVADRARDWCHHFAAAPKGIYADSNWVRFGQRAGIDLRSLPYACLVLEASPTDRGLAAVPATAARILGRPQFFKPYARLLNCESAGVALETIPKRNAAPLLKHLEKTRGPLLYHWTRETGVIIAGAPLVATPDAVP